MDPISPPGHKARLVLVPKKRLPGKGEAAKGRERFYAVVEATAERDGGDGDSGGDEGLVGSGGGGASGSKQGGAGANDEGGSSTPAGASGIVSSGVKALIAKLQGSQYETTTRGTRHQGPARLLAEAVYVIGRGGKR